MIRRIALAGIAAGAAGLLVGAGLGGAWGTAICAAAAAGLPVALAALGAARRGSLGPAGWGLAALLVLLEAGALALLLLPPSRLDGPTLLGLPLRLTLFLGGLWFLPMLVALAASAADLGRRGITASDLERLRGLRRLQQDRRGSGPPGSA